MNSKLVRQFEKARLKAEEITKNNLGLKKLVNDVKECARKRAKYARTIKMERLFAYVKAFSRIIEKYLTREYKKLPWGALVSIVGSLIYFLNPFDLIPDFIVGIGLLDDLTVILWVVKNIKEDLDNFLMWEANQRSEEAYLR